ncbi:MAG TPA: TetR family transcriptional regulator [Solirubrobacterales bacterium]|nr:TetR family transcriptional regulator [Solirubrobacterales bacterium]
MSEGCWQRTGEGEGAALGPLLARASFEAAQARLGGEGEAGALRTRRALARAALELSGEVGYDGVTVGALVARAEANRERFYRTFASKEACWLAAYRCGIEELGERLLGACARGRDWAAGIGEALEELADFLDAEPALARGLLAEVYVAGPAALATRKSVCGRLSRAIDRGREEAPAHYSPPPAITAEFLLGGIEADVRRSLLADPAGFRAEAPGLQRLAVVLYFGAEEARRRLAGGGR